MSACHNPDFFIVQITHDDTSLKVERSATLRNKGKSLRE